VTLDALCDRLHLTWSLARSLGRLLALLSCELVRLFVRMRVLVLVLMLCLRGPRRLRIRVLALRGRAAAVAPVIALLTL
jgi:hypothetical protein